MDLRSFNPLDEAMTVALIGYERNDRPPDRFVIAGPGKGNHAVYLAEGSLSSLFDSAFTTAYQKRTGQAGASYIGHDWQAREISFKLEIISESPGDYGNNSARLKQAWHPEYETTIEISTVHSGTRYLKCRKSQEFRTLSKHDPFITGHDTFEVTATAEQPFWLAPEIRETWHFTGSNWAGETLTLENPGDVDAWPNYICTAPAKFILPDVSWTDDDDAEKKIALPFLAYGRGYLVQTDPLKEMLVSTDGRLDWAKMNGVYFQHPIPAHTPPTQVPIGVDPLPILPWIFPSEWKWWLSERLTEWMDDTPVEDILAITPKQVGGKIHELMTGSIPDWLPFIEPEKITAMTSTFVIDVINNTWGRISNMAGSTVQVRIQPRYFEPWG